MVLHPPYLKKTLRIALVVGTVLFAINQLDVVLSGRATTVVWLKAGLTYCVPFVVSNLGLLISARRDPGDNSERRVRRVLFCRRMQLTAQVTENRRLGPGSFVLRLSGCQALGEARPGQFVMLRGAWGRNPLLPRAFSILRTLPDGGCEILVKAVGRGTRLLAALEAGQPLALLGPLGHAFPAPAPGRLDLLVAGGVGLAPLLWHAERAQAAGAQVELFYGARSAADSGVARRDRARPAARFTWPPRTAAAARMAGSPRPSRSA